MRLLLWSLWMLSAWKWGDWRNWTKYQATILYMLYCSLVYELLCYEYPLWRFEPDASVPFLVNHVLVSIVLGIIVYSSIVLLFLGRYPEGSPIWKQAGWMLLFTCVFSSAEFIMGRVGGISYHHGWSIGWTFLFNVNTFLMLRLHYRRPLLAWVLSIFFTVFYMYYFRVPIEIQK